jgi:hypothetical protein
MKQLLTIFVLMSAMAGYSQKDSLASAPFKIGDSGPEPSYHVGKILDRISVGGSYRFYGWNRSLEEGFRVIPSNEFASTPPYVLGVGDIYRDPPILLMNMTTRTGGGAVIGMDYALYSNFVGVPGSVPFNLNLGINLYGTIPTDVGKFGFQIGGIHWNEISGMVFGSFAGYERFSIFERSPWEEIGNASDRAIMFHEIGTIQRDGRWANQAFKGVLMDGYELPGGLSFKLLYGKTPATAMLGSTLPRYTTGGRLRKNFGNNFIGYNTINYTVYTDSLATEKGGINLHTLNAQWDIKDFQVSAEAGVGRLYSIVQEGEWGEGIRLKVKSPKRITFFPVELELFRIAPEFVNYYGDFLSSNTQILGTSDSQNFTGAGGGASSFAGSISNVGQVSSNRQGFSLNTWLEFGDTKINLGNMVSQEIENQGNVLAFGHRINALPLSRFVAFSNNVGPYGRWTSFFRGVAENIYITDLDTAGMPNSLTNFNMFQVHAKHLLRIPDHTTYIQYVGSYGSAADHFTLIPDMSDKSYLRSVYHELDFIMQLTPMFDVTLSGGVERIWANDQTNNIYYIDDNGQTAGANVEFEEGLIFNQYGIPGTQIPGSSYAGAAVPAQGYLDQHSWHFGGGIDVRINAQTGLYIRHRQFKQKDQNFEADDIRGSETNIELKIYF